MFVGKNIFVNLIYFFWVVLVLDFVDYSNGGYIWLELRGLEW